MPRALSRAVRQPRVLAALVAAPCALALLAPAAYALPADDVYPSQKQVDDAKAAAAKAASDVTRIERDYAAASATLQNLQGQLSQAMADVAAAQAELDQRTAELTQAQSDAAAAGKTRAKASQAIQRDAATMYQEQGGLGQWSAFLSGDGPQEMADYASAWGQVTQQRRTNLETARSSANLATEAKRRADVARSQQAQARAAADAARAAAQQRASAAQAQAERIQAEQNQRVAQLASLKKVAVKTEQDRQDGLAAEAARRAAEEAARREAARREAARQEAARRAAADAAAAAQAQAEAQAQANAPQAPAPAPAPQAPSVPQTPTYPTGGGGDARGIAQGMLGSFGFGQDQWSCLDQLWMGESGWNWSATNPSSGAYGIPQSLPASKMASAGGDWLTNPATQIAWGLGYIKAAYGTPCGAWSAWLSRSPHWY